MKTLGWTRLEQIRSWGCSRDWWLSDVKQCHCGFLGTMASLPTSLKRSIVGLHSPRPPWCWELRPAAWRHHVWIRNWAVLHKVVDEGWGDNRSLWDRPTHLCRKASSADDAPAKDTSFPWWLDPMTVGQMTWPNRIETYETTQTSFTSTHSFHLPLFTSVAPKTSVLTHAQFVAVVCTLVGLPSYTWYATSGDTAAALESIPQQITGGWPHILNPGPPWEAESSKMKHRRSTLSSEDSLSIRSSSPD